MCLQRKPARPDAQPGSIMKFAKYHALGNDYIVIDPADVEVGKVEAAAPAICRRNFGAGSDGILLGPSSATNGVFGLRIFNPDGSEAEKSGNGIRIFSRYLYDRGLVGSEPFDINTPGGIVRARVLSNGKLVKAEMGKVSFSSRDIPVSGPDREVLNENIRSLGRDFKFCAGTIGNPHCVLLCKDVSPGDARTFGPSIETDPRFPNRTNVQFMKALDGNNIRIEIWERGAGYTLASGSSASVAAAAARKLGMCDSAVNVHMPGGVLKIDVSDDFSVSMVGPVVKICEGMIDREILDTGR